MEQIDETSQAKAAVTINWVEGMESLKRLLTFIRELMELNSRLVSLLSPAERKNAEVLTAVRSLNPPAHTPSENKKQGYSIAEFAEFFGVHRSSLRNNLVEVPPGPAPPLPPGKIPCRSIGKVKRIFKEDIFGTQEDKAQRNDTFKETPSGADLEGDWRGQINRLRFANNAGR